MRAVSRSTACSEPSEKATWAQPSAGCAPEAPASTSGRCMISSRVPEVKVKK